MTPAASYAFIETYQYQSQTLPTKVAATVIRKALNAQAPAAGS